MQWRFTLELSDVFHNEDLAFDECRDIIVQRVKEAPFYDTDDIELIALIDELAEAEDGDYFDHVWDAFYDWADENRVWVATI
jgi:hypothetical protein